MTQHATQTARHHDGTSGNSSGSGSGTMTLVHHRSLAAPLLRAAGAPLHIDVRPDATPQEVLGSLQECLAGMQRLQATEEALFPAVAKLLSRVRHDKLYQDAGHDSMKAFILAEVVARHKISLTWAKDALKVGQAFPSLGPDEYRRYGAKRLRAAAAVTHEGEANLKHVLKLAETAPTAEDFRAALQEEFPARKGSGLVALTIKTTPRTLKRLRVWLALEEGRDDGAKILALIDGSARKPQGKAA